MKTTGFCGQLMLFTERQRPAGPGADGAGGRHLQAVPGRVGGTGWPQPGHPREVPQRVRQSLLQACPQADRPRREKVDRELVVLF